MFSRLNSLHSLAFPLRFLCVSFASDMRHIRQTCVDLRNIPMLELQSFQNKDLVLNISPNYDPNKEQNNG